MIRLENERGSSFFLWSARVVDQFADSPRRKGILERGIEQVALEFPVVFNDEIEFFLDSKTEHDLSLRSLNFLEF